MKNFWEKIKAFFSRIWQGLTVAGRIIFGLIIIGLIILAVYALSDTGKNDTSSDNKNEPEIAQVYEPSIGSPLPADTPGETSWENVGTVAGESTTVASTSEPKLAPNAGVDPKAPISYENTNLKFSATLPASTKVNEKNDSVSFTSKQGNLLYIVSTQNAGTETLKTIEAQLNNSPSTTNISTTSFANTPALKFSNADLGTGTVFISNGKIYYLLGDNKYFSTFKTL